MLSLINVFPQQNLMKKKTSNCVLTEHYRFITTRLNTIKYVHSMGQI